MLFSWGRVDPENWPSHTQKTHKHSHSHAHTHKKERKRDCRASTFQKNNLPQLEGWVNLGLLYFMPPHHWGPLGALSPFRTPTTPFTAPKVPAGFPGSLPSTLWRGFEPGKAKTMYNGASSTTHDPVMERERNMGEEGDESERGGRWRGRAGRAGI